MIVPVDETSGRFQADGLGSGPHTLTVTTGVGPALATSQVELEPGKTTREDLRVKRPTPGEAVGKKR